MEQKFMEKTEFLNKIKDTPLEGYLWLSDEHKPSRIYRNAKIDTSVFDVENPFVTEGLLYDRANDLSYQIKYIDGNYRIFEHSTLKQNADDLIEEKTYIAHRIDGVKKLRFAQIFTPQADKDCMNMKVLKLDRMVFKGFE